MEYKSNRNVVYSCKYHVIWCVKYRRKLINGTVEDRLKEIVHKLIKHIKGRSSKMLRQEFHHLTTRLPSLWTNSYFVSTVGDAPLSVIKQYIEEQKDK